MADHHAVEIMADEAVSEDLRVAPCGPVLGTEVSELRITEGLDAVTAARLRASLLRYKVLSLRDVDLSHAHPPRDW